MYRLPTLKHTYTPHSITTGKISLLGALGPEFEATLREHHALQAAGGAGGEGGGGGAGGLPEQRYGSLVGDDHTDLYPLNPAVQERLRMILRPFFLKYVACGVGRGLR